MGWKIKVASTSEEDVLVPGVGSVTPNKWVELTEAQVINFERKQGISIEKASGLFEVKDDKKKEDD